MKFATGVQSDKYRMPSFVDIHCHVDLFENPRRVLCQAEEQNIGVIAVTNAPSVFEYTAKITTATRYAQPALGLHPQLIEERATELELMLRLLHRTRFIGEIGLDYTNSRSEMRRRQRKIFAIILEHCEAAGDKILIVHSRRSAVDVMSAIGARFPCTIILHWYSGPRNVMDRAIENGFYFSVNPAMIRSKRGDEIIRTLPRDRVLTETDGPFVSVGSNSAVPLDVTKVITKLAVLWGKSEEETRRLIMRNYIRCLDANTTKHTIVS